MIIDMRCRLTTTEAAGYFYQRMANAGRLTEAPALADGSIEAFFREIGKAGITTAVSVSGNNPGATLGRHRVPDRTTSNDLLADVQRRYPGRFIGVAGIDAGNIFHNALEEIERCTAELGLKAVYIEPGRSPGCLLNDACLYPIYEKCMQLGIAVIPQTSGPLGGKNIDYANPKYIEQVAEDFPDLHIICGHGCYPFVREAIVMAARRANVWLSPDTYLLRLGQDDWVQAVNEDLFGFSDRFIFGSAYPLRSIKDYVDRFFELPWNNNVLEKILYRNALQALHLENDPLFIKMYNLDNTGGSDAQAG